MTGTAHSTSARRPRRGRAAALAATLTVAGVVAVSLLPAGDTVAKARPTAGSAATRVSDDPLVARFADRPTAPLTDDPLVARFGQRAAR